MRKIFGIIAAAIILFSLPAGAATYYVSQTNGSDSNSGLSSGAAWKYCPGMTAYTGTGGVQPGDTVYFDSADTWLVSGNWGLYLVGGVTYIGDTWGSGTRAELKAVSNMDAGVVRFQDDPKFETVFKGFNVNANGQVATGVNINHEYGQLMNGATKRIENCEVHNIWSRTSSGQYNYGIIISNHWGANYYTENVEVINCIVHDTSRDAICLYPGDENGDCRIKNITVRGCEAYNTGQDPDYSAGAGILIKGYVQDAYVKWNYVHDTQGAGILINGNETRHYGVGPNNIHLGYNIVNNPNMHGGIRIYDTASDPKDVKIYGNIVLDNTITGGLSIENNSGLLNLLVYNNTFYNSFVRFTKHSSNVATLEFKNNIIYSPNFEPLIADSGNIKQHAGNIYYGGSGPLVTIGDTSYTAGDLDSWESDAILADPLFKNTGALPTGFIGAYGTDLRPNRDGLSMRPESPAVDSGAQLDSAYGGSINSVSRANGKGWDRGAYELNINSRPSAPANLRILEVK